MTVVEAAERQYFGQITLEDMRKNELLTRTVLPLVGKVCAYTKGRFTIDTVADGLVSGAYNLWGVMRPPATLESVAVTRTDAGTFEILALGPEFREIAPFLERLQSVARSQKCAHIKLYGSPKWGSYLKKNGWHVPAVIYERAL